MKNKYIAHAQGWEWYGCEDNIGNPAHGRYKPKGGEDFIIELDDAEVYEEEKVLAKLNETFNVDGLYFKHEFKGHIDFYWPPVILKGSLEEGWKCPY